MTPRDWTGRDPGESSDGLGPHDVDDDLLDEEDEWTEEDERRYQARRQQERRRVKRRRRQGAAFAVVVLLVLGAGVGAAGLFQGWWSWPFGDDSTDTAAQVCPQPTPTAAAPADVTVTVLNSTDRTGLAGEVAAELSRRGFVIQGVANDPADTMVPEAAQVRHGPEGLMAARAVSAQIAGAVLVDDGRAGPAVELSLGAAFTAPTTPEQAAAAMAPPAPPSPAGCVPASPSPSETATQPATTAPPTTG